MASSITLQRSIQKLVGCVNHTLTGCVYQTMFSAVKEGAQLTTAPSTIALLVCQTSHQLSGASHKTVSTPEIQHRRQLSTALQVLGKGGQLMCVPVHACQCACQPSCETCQCPPQSSVEPMHCHKLPVLSNSWEVSGCPKSWLY